MTANGEKPDARLAFSVEDAVREKSLVSPSDSLLGDCLEKEEASPAYLPSREFASSYPNGRRPSIKSEQSSK